MSHWPYWVVFLVTVLGALAAAKILDDRDRKR